MQQHRERIIASAARAFRERGFGGSAVTDIMSDAGLTHGGFYGHFESKDDLEAAACADALAIGAARWSRLADEEPDTALARIVDSYLSTRHRDDPGTGCVFATLGGETARTAVPVRGAFAEGVRARIESLTRVVKGRVEATRRRRAIAALSGMVGAMVLARAVDDRALSNEILDAAREEFGDSRHQ